MQSGFRHFKDENRKSQEKTWHRDSIDLQKQPPHEKPVSKPPHQVDASVKESEKKSESIEMDSFVELLTEKFGPAYMKGISVTDETVWTDERLPQVFSNMEANFSLHKPSDPPSAPSEDYNEHGAWNQLTHTAQGGLTPIGQLSFDAGIIAFLSGFGCTYYQIYHKKELGTYRYLKDRLNELSASNKKYNQEIYGDKNTYQTFSKNEIMLGLDEFLKSGRIYNTTLPNNILPPLLDGEEYDEEDYKNYEEYFEPNMFIQAVNDFTSTKPMQIVGNIWDELDKTSLTFWIVWFAFSIFTAALLPLYLPIVVAVTFAMSGLRLLHKAGMYIYKKVTNQPDDAELEKKQAEHELLVNKLKQTYFMQQEHNQIMDMLHNQYHALIDYYLDKMPDDIYDKEEIEEYIKSRPPGTILIRKIKNCIAYSVICPDGTIVIDEVIPEKKIKAPEPFTRHNLNLLKTEILHYTTKKEHTKELKKYRPKKSNDKKFHDVNHFEIDQNRRKEIRISKQSDQPQPKLNQYLGLDKRPEAVLSGELAERLLGSKAERNGRLIVSTLFSVAMGFIFTSFILWLSATTAGIFPAAIGISNFLAGASFSSYSAISIGGLLGINTYCKVRAEQLAYEKKVYQVLTQQYSEKSEKTTKEKFETLYERVENKKQYVTQLRNELKTLNKDKYDSFAKQDLKEKKKAKDMDLVSGYDLKKVDVYNDYYFEKQRHKPSVFTWIKKGVQRIHQFVAGGQSGILITRTLCLAGGIVAGIFTGTLIPFLICAGVAALVMGGLQVAKYQLERNQQHREFFLDTIKTRIEWLKLKDKELDVVIEKLEENRDAAKKRNAALENREPTLESQENALEKKNAEKRDDAFLKNYRQEPYLEAALSQYQSTPKSKLEFPEPKLPLEVPKPATLSDNRNSVFYPKLQTAAARNSPSYNSSSSILIAQNN